MNLREAAQQALKVLDKSLHMNDYSGLEVSKHDAPDVSAAIEALRAALAEPDEVAAEREACALICESLIIDASGIADATAWQCAAAIRARGEE